MRTQRQDSLWIFASVIILTCNALDAALTVCAIETGEATEANPIMAALLAHGTLEFVLVKHLMVALGLIVLWHFRAFRLARVGAWAVVPVYPLIVLYEVIAMLS